MQLCSAVLLLLTADVAAFRVRQKRMPKELRAQKKANSSAGYVITLGDSYSSGTGIHKHVSQYHNGEECCRDFKTTPGSQLANTEGKQHLMPACAGDEIPQIREQFAGLQADYPQEAASGWEGSVIMFTIGGNDIRSNGGDAWPILLVNCILSFYGACHEEAKNQVANFDEVQGQLQDFYSTVAQGASKATIRIWGYPRLLQRTWHCIPVPGVSAAATRWMDNMVDELNGRLAAAVSTVKRNNPSVDIEFVPVTEYLNKGACSASGNHVHAIVFSGDTILSPMTFHPSQRGYNMYYDSLASSLGRSLPPSQVWPGTPEPWYIDRIFQGWDQDGDGGLSVSDALNMAGEDAHPEALSILRRVFAEADVDQDGSLTVAEFETFLASIENATQ